MPSHVGKGGSNDKHTSGRNALTGGDPLNDGGDRNQDRLRVLTGRLGAEAQCVKKDAGFALPREDIGPQEDGSIHPLAQSIPG